MNSCAVLRGGRRLQQYIEHVSNSHVPKVRRRNWSRDEAQQVYSICRGQPSGHLSTISEQKNLLLKKVNSSASQKSIIPHMNTYNTSQSLNFPINPFSMN